MYPVVYFRHKLKKLLNGHGFRSAKHHLRRPFHKSPFPLHTARVIQTIDAARFEEILRRYVVNDPGEDWPKYLDLNRWIYLNIRRIRRLELDLAPRQRILDLGCGAGYFAYIAQLLGHDVTGLDIGNVPMFTEITRLLGVPRVTWCIQAFAPLPDFGKKFDLITAYMICFNEHKQPGLWGVPEWEFFLDDLASHLAPGGRVWLELNREYDGTCYTSGLREFFERCGAMIEEHRVGLTVDSLALSSVSSAVR